MHPVFSLRQPLKSTKKGFKIKKGVQNRLHRIRNIFLDGSLSRPLSKICQGSRFVKNCTYCKKAFNRKIFWFRSIPKLSPASCSVIWKAGSGSVSEMYGCHARCHGSYLSLLLLDLVLVLPVVEGLQQHLGSILVSSQRVLRMRTVALHIYRTEPLVLSVFQSFRCRLNLEPGQLGETCIVHTLDNWNTQYAVPVPTYVLFHT